MKTTCSNLATRFIAGLGLAALLAGPGCTAETSPCPDGGRPGRCGLQGRCVDCNQDKDCGPAKICDDMGVCRDHLPCGPENRCAPDKDCSQAGLCRPICPVLSGFWCGWEGGECVDYTYCEPVRCSPEGRCPEGWENIPGSLRCRLSSCSVLGLRDGICGKTGECVECNLQADCDASKPGSTCVTWGGCWDIEGCLMTSQCQDLRYEYYYLRVCYGYECVTVCDEDWMCGYMGKCGLTFCLEDSCTANGQCSEGWVPVPGMLLCDYNPCASQGSVKGGCGLADRCLECLVDEHCATGICDLSGRCVPAECAVDADCPAERRCAENRCVAPCLSDSDCAPEGICTSSGLCRTVRCTQRGRCSAWGWRPTDGTLACHYGPCPTPSFYMKFYPGVCGLEQVCIQCLTDADCPARFYCSLEGECLLYPECDPGAGKTCPDGGTCLQGICWPACDANLQCPYGGECILPEGYCFNERCAPDGTCPPGWEPGTYGTVGRSLRCVKQL